MSGERLLMRGKYGPGPSYQWRVPDPADLIAAVRREVESGTIKGEVVKAWPYEDTACIHMHSVDVGPYLVIPVSDGGSET